MFVVWPELKDPRDRELSWQLGVRETVEINISEKEQDFKLFKSS
jgi:hypothetical protein